MFGQIDHPTVDGRLQRDPTHIPGYSINVQGELSMVGIEIKMLNHFSIIHRKDDLPKSPCAEQPIPQVWMTDTPWDTVKTATVA